MSNLQTELYSIVNKSTKITCILQALQKIQPPHWYLGAGCIAQSVWNHICNCDVGYAIKDYDIVYFDKDISAEKEQQYTHKIREYIPQLDIDVTNQARVHCWYEKIFGKRIEPYHSVEQAIQSWPTTATAIGIRQVQDKFEVYAPFGLDDLFSLTVRANKWIITQDIYENKTKRWQQKWPQLNIIPWNS